MREASINGLARRRHGIGFKPAELRQAQGIKERLGIDQRTLTGGLLTGSSRRLKCFACFRVLNRFLQRLDRRLDRRLQTALDRRLDRRLDRL